MKNTTITTKSMIDKKWFIVDADGQVLGRLATIVASILRGKNKVYFCNYLDCGDNVIIINANKIKFTGNKLNNKIYYHHTGYPGGLKSINAADRMKADPSRLVKDSIKGMLPHNRLGRAQLRNLYVYDDDVHPHAAQKPEALKLTKNTVKENK